MDVVLYKNFSVENKLNKNLTQVAKYVGVQVVEPVDDYDIQIRMTVPTDTLKWSNVNYFQFDGAYYFLESVDKEANSISTVNGRMDLLMTYAGAIKALKVQPERSTSHGSMRLEDENRRITVDTHRTVIDFPMAISGEEGEGLYILTTAQGGYYPVEG